jgi:hypothetical protein
VLEPPSDLISLRPSLRPLGSVRDHSLSIAKIWKNRFLAYRRQKPVYGSHWRTTTHLTAKNIQALGRRFEWSRCLLLLWHPDTEQLTAAGMNPRGSSSSGNHTDNRWVDVVLMIRCYPPLALDVRQKPRSRAPVTTVTLGVSWQPFWHQSGPLTHWRGSQS